jgi:hypothetical protein
MKICQPISGLDMLTDLEKTVTEAVTQAIERSLEKLRDD